MTNVIHFNFRPEYDTDETADEILRSMAGMPIPSLSSRKVIDLTPQDDLRLCIEYLRNILEILEER